MGKQELFNLILKDFFLVGRLRDSFVVSQSFLSILQGVKSVLKQGNKFCRILGWVPQQVVSWNLRIIKEFCTATKL